MTDRIQAGQTQKFIKAKGENPTGGAMHRGLVITAMLLFAAGSAWGQSPPTNEDQAAQIKALLERVSLLEKRLAEVEAKQAAAAGPAAASSSLSAAVTPTEAPTAAPAAPPAEAPAPAPVEATTKAMPGHDMGGQMDQAAVRQLEPHYPNLQIRGFADADFSATDQKGTNSGFDLGQLTLHMASALSPKISYFAEMTFNAHPTGYTVEVERSIIRYDYNDYFKVSFGRYHTPIGYWNTAFHHGAWLQTSIDRPEMVKFGGTFTPIHFVGFLVEGNIPSGGLGLAYSVGVGNGRGEIISRPGDAGDNNNNRAWVANLYARPQKLYGLQFGGSVYRDKISLGGGNDYREWIGSAHVVWTRGAPELLAEFENVNHESILTGKVSNSDAYYVQVGYRMPWVERTLKPYYRFEYLHTPTSEVVLGNLDLVESIFGLRYDISSYAGFKAEYRHTNRQVLATPTFDGVVNGLFLQTSFT
ncbi:MAG: porin, partial [Candidatus Acidiferrum sp.]